MADTASNPDWGFITQADAAAVAEMEKLFTNVNAAGIPDTIETLDVNVNAVWGRFVYNFILYWNGLGNGEITPLPPGLSGLGSTSDKWRLHDDFSQHVGTADFTAKSIPVPDLAYPCNGSRANLAGGFNLINDASVPNQRGVYHIVNARGGVTDSHDNVLTRALRTHRDLHYWSDGNDTLADADTAVAFRLHMTEWPQHNERVVLMSHRQYNGATETGVSFRLGWELALAAGPSPTSDPKDRVLEFRDMDNVDTVRTVQLGSGVELDTLPLSGDIHIAFVREPNGPDQQITFYLNGVPVQTTVMSGISAPGTDPNMRLVVGSDWDGSKNSNAAFRDIAVWKLLGAGLPNAGNIKDHARMTSGFTDVGPPPP